MSLLGFAGKARFTPFRGARWTAGSGRHHLPTDYGG
jgi:hypothetical protein